MEKTGRFSTYAILVPVEYRFAKEPKLFWKFRPSTSRDELALTIFSTQESSFLGPDGNSMQRRPNIIEVAWREIATLFAGSNIPTSEISASDLASVASQEDVDRLVDALPRLPVNASVEQVEVLLGQMPHEMVAELWFALGEANPGWGPKKEKKI